MVYSILIMNVFNMDMENILGLDLRTRLANGDLAYVTNIMRFKSGASKETETRLSLEAFATLTE